MKNFLKWGIYITALNIVFMLVGYAAGWTTQPMGRIIGWISMAASLVLLFMGVKERKDTDSDDFTFGKGWVEGILISLVAAVMFAIFLFVFTSYINPEMIEYAKSETSKGMQTMPKDQLEAAQGMMNLMFSPTGYALVTLLSYAVLGMVVSLLISPIVKSLKGPVRRTENI